MPSAYCLSGGGSPVQTVGLGGPLYLFWLCGRGKDPGWPEKGMLLESPAWPEKGMLLGSPAVARGLLGHHPLPGALVSLC